MIKNYICEKKMLSQYISVQIYSKMIQIIVKLDEMFIHIFNVDYN
jgi:hypothetical protein